MSNSFLQPPPPILTTAALEAMNSGLYFSSGLSNASSNSSTAFTPYETISMQPLLRQISELNNFNNYNFNYSNPIYSSISRPANSTTSEAKPTDDIPPTPLSASLLDNAGSDGPSFKDDVNFKEQSTEPEQDIKEIVKPKQPNRLNSTGSTITSSISQTSSMSDVLQTSLTQSSLYDLHQFSVGSSEGECDPLRPFYQSLPRRAPPNGYEYLRSSSIRSSPDDPGLTMLPGESKCLFRTTGLSNDSG